MDSGDFPDSGIPVAAALKGPIAGSNASKMVVVTDGDFAVGGQGRNARQLNKDNRQPACKWRRLAV
ncbi:MAG: hypothetical protein U5L09_14265 [Bacteroidales bacterium]|nr:hypothetical protein [Bacteroidales bacterium]